MDRKPLYSPKRGDLWHAEQDLPWLKVEYEDALYVHIVFAYTEKAFIPDTRRVFACRDNFARFIERNGYAYIGVDEEEHSPSPGE